MLLMIRAFEKTILARGSQQKKPKRRGTNKTNEFDASGNISVLVWHQTTKTNLAILRQQQ